MLNMICNQWMSVNTDQLQDVDLAVINIVPTTLQLSTRASYEASFGANTLIDFFKVEFHVREGPVSRNEIKYTQ
jgi:hypothetical protein